MRKESQLQNVLRASEDTTPSTVPTLESTYRKPLVRILIVRRKSALNEIPCEEVEILAQINPSCCNRCRVCRATKKHPVIDVSWNQHDGAMYHLFSHVKQKNCCNESHALAITHTRIVYWECLETIKQWCLTLQQSKQQLRSLIR